MQNLPRGLRNNNPLNIRISSIQWQGKIAENTDGAFEQFISLEYGLRAGLVNIRTYIKRDHLDSISVIIPKWAPALDGNDVRAYVRLVSNKSSVPATRRLSYNDRYELCRIVWAMAWVECGQEISFSAVEKAWNLI